MPNVPVPALLRIELAASDLVVWSATRTKKGEPITVQIAGPGISTTPFGYGLTIEEAVADALRNPWFLQQRPGVVGAMARLEEQLRRLEIDLFWKRYGCIGGDDLDDDVPF